MKRYIEVLIFSLSIILLTFGVLGGATNVGLLTPQYRMLTLVLMALVSVGWLIIHWRAKWVWHHDPLSIAFVLFGTTIGISFLANSDSWRRMIIGLWFLAAYLGFWYLLQDVITNKGIRRKALIDILLVVGAIVLYTAYKEIIDAFSAWIKASATNPVPLQIPRVQGTLANPNILAAFFVVLIPLIISRALDTPKIFWKVGLALYTAMSFVLLVITDSRASWIGAGAALATWIVLLLQNNDLLSVAHLRSWWRSQAITRKAFGISIVVILMFFGVLMTFRVVHTLGETGTRSLALRTYIYDGALTIFRERPLTGTGFFTFGRGLLRLASTPPYTPHAHAHDLVLNVAAELGIPGLIALLVTVLLTARAMYRNWKATNKQEHILLAGAIAGVIGIAVNHLLDMPAVTSPMIFVVGLIVFALAVVPYPSLVVRSKFPRVQTLFALTIWGVVLLAGFWNVKQYTDYVSALFSSAGPGGYEQAAQRLEALSTSDPSMPIYYLYAGYFRGALVGKGDTKTAELAIKNYQTFCTLEPYYAPAWANMSLLYWQTDQQDQAIEAMKKAAGIASLDWRFQFILGTYYEATGQIDAAKQFYSKTLSLYPDVSLYKEWDETPLRRNTASQNTTYSPDASVVKALESNHVDEAWVLWQKQKSPVIGEILALQQGDLETAKAQLALAMKSSADPENDQWVQLGIAYLARFKGDELAANDAREKINLILFNNILDDKDKITTIVHGQFWSLGFVEYLLPQVYSPYPDAVFVNLLDHSFDEF